MTRFISSFCILAISLWGLSPGMTRFSNEQPDQANIHKNIEEDTLTVLLTGNVLSTLKPCGCTTEQLGGFDKRAAIIEQTPPDRTLLIDTGNLLADETEQDNIKLGIIFQALSTLGYDLVNLTEDDLRIAGVLGLLEDVPFKIISYACDDNSDIGAGYTRRFQFAGKSLSVTVATADALSGQINSLTELFASGSGSLQLNILIINNCDESTIDRIVDLDLIDVIICPTSADEPRVVNIKNPGPLFISVGQFGEYFGRLTVGITPGQKFKFDYRKVPIEEKLPSDPGLVQLYKDYQLMVREEDLLGQVSRVTLPNGLEYLGSKSCGLAPCHKYEYKIWSKKSPHNHAYQTLVKVGSQYDPECVICHVVGLTYETGFVSEKSQKDLRDVGCEVCHGPGSKHMAALLMNEKDSGTDEPKSRCIDCHTSEHSPEFEAKEQQYRKKIVHWKEQNRDEDVKN